MAEKVMVQMLLAGCVEFCNLKERKKFDRKFQLVGDPISLDFKDILAGNVVNKIVACDGIGQVLKERNAIVRVAFTAIASCRIDTTDSVDRELHFFN